MYVWDENKREWNITNRGLDFADAGLVFENPDKITFASERHGEQHGVDIAMVEVYGVVLTLVYVERGKDIRVISFRRASRKERKLYARAKEQD